MKTNKKNISSNSKTFARIMSMFYVLIATMILDGILVLNSSTTERPFWLSSTDSMSTLVYLAFVIVLILNILTKSIFFPFLSYREKRALDERQRLVRNNAIVTSFYVMMFVVPVFTLFLRKQIEANLSFAQSQGSIVLPVAGIIFLIVGLPSAIAAWNKTV